MEQYKFFLPCGKGITDYLVEEVTTITPDLKVFTKPGGVMITAQWQDLMRLNLYSRLASRVLLTIAENTYKNEQDLYDITYLVPWEMWFHPNQTFKIHTTAKNCPLKSLNFTTLRIKDAIVDRFRSKLGQRPSVRTQDPEIYLQVHLTDHQVTLYIDTSGEPLFKRGWRQFTGDAPLKETLAASMLYASGWVKNSGILYDPCCGSGTLLIEAAQILRNIPPGKKRRFAFERLIPHQKRCWIDLKNAAQAQEKKGIPVPLFGSDISFRMVDFAQKNAKNAGVEDVIEFRAGDALERKPPISTPGLVLLNPPYGERMTSSGKTAHRFSSLREQKPEKRLNSSPVTTLAEDTPPFFVELAKHWKQHYTGWDAWILSADKKLPNKMGLQAHRRVPLYNGAIDCRLFGFRIYKPNTHHKT
jgi:putative N6-adenine-specific DNA methylase